VTNTLTPDMLLAAYANGYFPMALNKDDPELYWFSPEERGVLPLESFNIPRGLARAMKKHDYTITVDTAFEQVIRACGTLTKERHETWINENIVQLYTALFEAGHAHSIEVWEGREGLGAGGVTSRQSPVATNGAAQGVVPLPLGERLGQGAGSLALHAEPPLTQPSPPGGEGFDVAPTELHNAPLLTSPLGGEGFSGGEDLPSSDFSPAPSTPPPALRLVGGLYGVSLGGAFFGESMFSRAPDASKMALVRLVEILLAAEYQLLDTQYVNDHLKQFGVEGWTKRRYMTKLAKALMASPNPSTRFSTASVRSGAASSSSLR